ncbi:MAG: stage II sporulation protein R [Ruminococcus sp.]|nr:stage II sporulation protein R [Ruminococcus sp.]
MKLFFKSLCVGIVVSILFTFIPFEGECRQISEQVFRIHILANSDSEEDQTLKLMVRDAVLAKSQELFKSARDKTEAMQITQENLDELVGVAQETVYSAGYSYPVTASIKPTSFDTRYYDAVTMPSGVYDALQIRIGDAKGKNWWCVMYPSLCIPAASEVNTLEEELTSSQYSIISADGKFEFRLKILEVFNGILEYFSHE